MLVLERISFSRLYDGVEWGKEDRVSDCGPGTWGMY